MKFVLAMIALCVVLLAPGSRLLGAPGAPARDARPFRILTADFPPYNYEENGEIIGICADVVRELLRRVEQPHAIDLVPWGRAQKWAREDERVALFSIMRTPKRENMFHWIGPLASYKAVLYARKDGGVAINEPSDLRRYTVGGLRNTPAESILEQLGARRVDLSSNERHNPRKLVAGRFDLWLTSLRTGWYRAIRSGIDPNLIEPVFFLREVPIYLAMSKRSAPETARRWQATLDAMKSEPLYKEIIARYDLCPYNVSSTSIDLGR